MSSSEAAQDAIQGEAPDKAPEKEAFGVLTSAALRRSRQRLGIPQPQRNPPHNFEVTWDGVAALRLRVSATTTRCSRDPDYAAKTRWGALIAPPTFHYTMGEDAAPKPDPETKALLKGDPFAGLGLLPGGHGVRVVAAASSSATAAASCRPRSAWSRSRAPSAAGPRTSPMTSSTPTARAKCTRSAAAPGSTPSGTPPASARRSSGSPSPTRPSSWPRSTPPTRPRPAAAPSRGYWEDVEVGEGFSRRSRAR